MIKYIFLLFLLTACGIDRDMQTLSEDDQFTLNTYRQLSESNRLQISDENEPGDPLTMCLQFVDLATKDPLINQRVHFYHADVNGEYSPAIASDETTARLNGEALTDNQGRIFLKTTLPGDYGSSSDNRHIHTTVFGAKPEAYDIHFKQYTGFMGTRFIKGSNQHFLANLQKDDSDNLISFLTIEVKNP